MLAAASVRFSNSVSVRNWRKTFGLFVKLRKLSCVYILLSTILVSRWAQRGFSTLFTYSIVRYTDGWRIKGKSSMKSLWGVENSFRLSHKTRTSGSSYTWKCIICIHTCVSWLCSRIFISSGFDQLRWNQNLSSTFLSLIRARWSDVCWSWELKRCLVGSGFERETEVKNIFKSIHCLMSRSAASSVFSCRKLKKQLV